MGLKLNLDEKYGSVEEQANKQGYSFGKNAEIAQNIVNAFNTLKKYDVMSLSVEIMITKGLIDKLDELLKNRRNRYASKKV